MVQSKLNYDKTEAKAEPKQVVIKDKLEEILDSQEQTEIWQPKENDKLMGVLTEKRKTGKFGSTLFVIKTEDEKILGLWSNAVLSDKLGNVSVGSHVGVKYIGQSKSEKGRNYRNYRVVVLDANDI